MKKLRNKSGILKYIQLIVGGYFLIRGIGLIISGAPNTGILFIIMAGFNILVFLLMKMVEDLLDQINDCISIMKSQQKIIRSQQKI